MRLKPIKDFLYYIAQCHRELADFYLRLSIEVNNDKVKLLLDFMRNKEQLSYLQLQQYTQQAPPGLLETGLDSEFNHNFPMQCQQMALKAELSIDEVVALATNFNIQLIELLQNAAYNSPTIEAEIALEKLTNQEEETLHQVVLASHEFEYM
ncbi:MAG: hypothetical protein ACJAZP_002898 [Psychromonas sp.]|jgi:hypothetical protein|uniref:hypothetical protein n=1 Tax=Psychromonas sp. TaxID=1884585 RepID=UPI0039E69F38